MQEASERNLKRELLTLISLRQPFTKLVKNRAYYR